METTLETAAPGVAARRGVKQVVSMYERAKRFNEITQVPLRIAAIVAAVCTLYGLVAPFPRWIFWGSVVGLCLFVLAGLWSAVRLKGDATPKGDAERRIGVDSDEGSSVNIRGHAHIAGMDTAIKLRGKSTFSADSKEIDR